LRRASSSAPRSSAASGSEPIGSSTRMSRSDSGVSSPRATDPKRSRGSAEIFLPASRISCRYIDTSLPIGPPRGIGTIAAGTERVATALPHASRTRSSVSARGMLTPVSYLAIAACDVPTRKARACWVRPTDCRAVRMSAAVFTPYLCRNRHENPTGRVGSPNGAGSLAALGKSKSHASRPPPVR
jgi:hypothetical protein